MAVLQVAHSVLEQEHVAKFIQRISEVIDTQQAAPVASIEGHSVQPCSVAKSEGSDDEVDGTVAIMPVVNSSPPSTMSNSQKESMPAVGSEVHCLIDLIYTVSQKKQDT